MAQVWVWPYCTFPGCDHKRTWRTPDSATAASERHPSWVVGSQAVCYCHGADNGATFPCDETEKATHHA